MTDAPILALENARISYFGRAGEVNVVPGLTFSLAPGEAMGLVGESGCGKSTVALAIVRYLGRAGRIVGGRIVFEGRDVAAMTVSELRAMRGRRVAMVYQDPMASLNPVMTVGRQLMEVPMLHEGLGERAARARALDMLAEVRLQDGESVLGALPASALRWPAAAHRHRDGPHRRARAADHGRADHGARRDGGGGRARAGARAPPATRHIGPLHQPQPGHGRASVRPDRRHVRRRAGRGRLDPAGVQESASSLHARASRLPAVARPRQATGPARPHPRPGGAGSRAARRLRLCRALCSGRARPLYFASDSRPVACR